MKGSLKSHGCHILEWFDKCEYAFIYFDMADLICSKRASPYFQQPLELFALGRQEGHTPASLKWAGGWRKWGQRASPRGSCWD